jgi:hypothetical protein
VPPAAIPPPKEINREGHVRRIVVGEESVSATIVAVRSRYPPAAPSQIGRIGRRAISIYAVAVEAADVLCARGQPKASDRVARVIDDAEVSVVSAVIGTGVHRVNRIQRSRYGAVGRECDHIFWPKRIVAEPAGEKLRRRSSAERKRRNGA